MSGGKRLVSALLALAMVGQLGMMTGMADVVKEAEKPFCSPDSHQSCPVKLYSPEGTLRQETIHWISGGSANSGGSLQGGKGTNYFYPKASDTTIHCQKGEENIIILSGDIFSGETFWSIDILYFSPDKDKIVLDGLGGPPEEGESVLAAEGGEGELELSVSGDRTVSLQFSLSLPSETGEVAVEAMPPAPASIPSFSLQEEDGSFTVPSTDDYTYLLKNSDGSYTNRISPPSASGVDICSFIAVENKTGRCFSVSGPCLVKPAGVSITATGNSGSLTNGDSLDLKADETRTYTLKAQDAYSGLCGEGHGSGSSHGYQITWEIENDPSGGITVEPKNGAASTMTIDSEGLGTGSHNVTLTATVKKAGSSDKKSATLKFTVSATEPPAVAEPPVSAESEPPAAADPACSKTLKINAPSQNPVSISDSETPQKITFSAEWEGDCDDESHKTAKKHSIKEWSVEGLPVGAKADLPEVDGPMDAEDPNPIPLTLLIYGNTFPSGTHAITLYAVVDGERLPVPISLTKASSPEPGGGDDPGEEWTLGGLELKSETGTVSGSGKTNTDVINIASGSASKVSYTYSTNIPSEKAGDYSYEWDLLTAEGKSVSGDPGHPYISFAPVGDPPTSAKVTVSGADLPSSGVDETFKLTVTVKKSSGINLLARVIAAIAPLSEEDTKTLQFDIRVYAAPRSGDSAGSSKEPNYSDWYQWRDVEKDIDRAKKGSTVKASLGSNTDMPFYIFDALRGEDVSLQMKIGGGYTWTLNGRTVQQLPQNKIWVALGVESYSNSQMTALCRESKIKSFQLENTGSFYGDMRLTMNLGSSYAKKTVYLYSYNELNNKLTYSSSAKVADNGDVDFVFARSLGAYAVTSKALYGESAVSAGGGTVGAGNRPTAIYPPVVSVPASQAPAASGPSSGGSSSSGSEPAPPPAESSSIPDAAPAEAVVQPEPEPEDAPIPFIVPLLILAIAGVIAATVVVVNSRNRSGFEIE